MRAELLSVTGSWLLTYLLHSTMLLVTAWAMTYRLVRSPALRELVWKTALIGGLVTASIQLGAGWEPLGGAMRLTQRSPAAAERPSRPEAWHGEMLPSTPAARADAPARASALLAPPVVAVPVITVPVIASTVTVSPAAAPSVIGSIVTLWALIGLALFLRYLIIRARVLHRIGPRRPVHEPVLVAMLETLRHTGSVRQQVQLTAAGGLTSPVALGRAEIALPDAALTDLDREQQRGMLAHELAHLVRRDPSWLTAACVLERLFFLQPLNRLARVRMQESAELLCDDWAVRRTGSGFSLASCLVKVAEWVDTPPHPLPLAGMAEHRSQLVTRIHRLIEAPPMPTAPRSLWFAAGAVALLGITAVAAPGVTPHGPKVASEAALDSIAAEDDGELAYAASLSEVSDTDSVVARSWRGGSNSAEIRAELSRARASSRADMRRAMAEVRIAGSAMRPPHAPMAPMAPMAPTAAVAAMAMNEMRAPAAMGWGVARGGRWSDHEGKRDTTSIAVPALIAALKDSDVQVRRTAAQSLSNFQDPRSVPGLVEALKDGDAEVRTYAAVALGNMEDPRALPGLLIALKDSNRDVRQTALSALHSMPGQVPDEAILTALNDSDADVRQSAISLAISTMSDHDEDEGRKADPRYVTAFSKLLGDANADVRQQAADGLGMAGLTEAPAALLAASRDKNADVRGAVARSLGQIGNARSVPTLKELIGDSSADVREAAVESLSQIRDQAALEALVGALKSSDPVVRRSAAEALGQRGD